MIVIHPVFQGVGLKPGYWFRMGTNGDSLSFSKVTWYISGLSFFHGNEKLGVEKINYRLMDFNLPETFSFKSDIPEGTNRIVFKLGVDSLDNISGAMTGALDPVNGMFWAWNTGYINIKLEGRCSNCTDSRKEFQFHIGGYLPPYTTCREIELDIPPRNLIEINFDLALLIEAAGYPATTHIMSPGKSSVQVSDVARTAFYITP